MTNTTRARSISIGLKKGGSDRRDHEVSAFPGAVRITRKLNKSLSLWRR